ncbi:MAG: tRNA uridine-5-carboxymethylaminomethyl(34) synthesis GTPase MnmE, partial [Deltaproteobacteria bacterium]|nr:tRNA uridine-5-carboxymethylaminomethyl(34) synthesis GTPase MnmE [Deltaproteobacteria bacterium]
AWVSLLTGEGLEGLWGFLEGLAAAAGVRFDEDTGLITRARHLEALAEALGAARRATEAAEMGLDAELVAMDLREALDGLGRMTGAVTSDEILNRIFAGFCIGK